MNFQFIPPLSPSVSDELPRLVTAAMEAIQVRDFERGAEFLERAVKLKGDDINMLLDLGLAHASHYNFPAAEINFEKAVRLADRKGLALTLAGKRCFQSKFFEMAERYLTRAADRSDSTPETFVTLAEIYERQHRMDDAMALVERAFKKQPDFPPAMYMRAKLQRQTGKLEEAEKNLRVFLQRPEYELWLRALAWYELGGILDRQGRYDEAMTAFLEAKTLLLPSAKNAIATQERRQATTRESGAGITREMLQGWLAARDHVTIPRRLAVLGGHPRSGTTLLEQVLDSHPEVVSAEETMVFNDEVCLPLIRRFNHETPLPKILESISPDDVTRLRAHYYQCNEALLGRKLDSPLLIEKNPALNVLFLVALKLFPESKFLMAVRDPRDVCMSCFMQPLRFTALSSSYLTLEGTVKQYSSVMEFWQKLLPLIPESHIEVRYEELVEDLEGVSRRVLQFLGLNWDAKVLRFHEHAQKKLVRSPTFADVTKPVFKHAVGRWRNYRKYLEPHLEKLEPHVKAFRYD